MFALGGRRTGIELLAAGLEGGMDTEYTGVERRALPIGGAPEPDPALNRGNAGGAPAAWRGAVGGITPAVAGSALGLAVPINATPRTIFGESVAPGRVRRAWLCVAGMPGALPP